VRGLCRVYEMHEFGVRIQIRKSQTFTSTSPVRSAVALERTHGALEAGVQGRMVQ
jgi:hypothetical protein